MTPHVFISYSWTSQTHQELIRSWADRLILDRVNVTVDFYDLREGDDKFKFMERMVADPEVTNVLVICDRVYSEKADQRIRGVGTESQIMSKEIYEKTIQSKFIPIVCEMDGDGEPFLPVFLKSRIWINFSTTESVNENWEQLIRLLYNKPLYQKPQLGNVPAYLADDSAPPSSPIASKFSTLEQAILRRQPSIERYRQDFLESCINYADSLRVRERPNVEALGERIVEDCGRLKVVRDYTVDWILLEVTELEAFKFSDILVSQLERILELKSRPYEMNTWNDAWFEAHSIFVYETFLYTIAALIKKGANQVLHEVFTRSFLHAKVDRDRGREFCNFGQFYGYSEALQSVLSEEGKRLYSPAAELINRQANRRDIPFSSIAEAELLVYMMALITPGVRWYPGTLHYSGYHSDFPLFLRAAQHSGFERLATIVGVSEVPLLRVMVKEGFEDQFKRPGPNFMGFDFWGKFNLDNMNTIK